MTESSYSIPNPELAPGSVHAGFTVERVETVEEADGVAYLMRHSSGARLIWLACADDNRSFTIGFKTPPADDTGVFHIIEHSVLDGSDRFPVKEPFVHLLKSSMKTFLNALTFPDKTVYPVASTNMHDLENLMDVYLDAVFHPLIYSRESIFEQEAWHYELSGEGDAEALSYNGVVFNEMKGALSDPDSVLFNDVCKGLFPDSTYRFESGGDPRAIPQLTYEGFLDAHARHYNLPNSYTFLYGDMDIEHMLAFIAERFDAVEERSSEPANPLPKQAPVQGGYRRLEMATAPENASVGIGYVVCDSSDRETIFNAEILCDALMGSNEAPLKRRLMQAGLGEDVSAQLIDGVLQPVLFVQLKGAKEGVAEEFRTLFETSVAQIREQGIDRTLLDASLSRAEFTLREREFGFFTNGIAYAVQALSCWLYDDDAAFDNLHYEDLIAQAKEGLGTSLFEDTLERMVNANDHSVLVELVPCETGASDEETAELAEKLATMDEEQRQGIRERLAILRAEQEAPDSPEAIATLPRLTVADIGESVPEPATSMLEGPIPCFTYGIPTNQV
ncbi:MAG: insulinase family protein, partial [Atopobiaceae bacterium]|nr:insulinase family protein [Atopobiaceae bacterium]